MRFTELATRAALGTANRPVGVHELPRAVAATLPDEPASGSAVALLDAAASYALVRASEVAPR